MAIMSELSAWTGRRPSPGEALFIAGFCTAVVVVSGWLVLADDPSLFSVLFWLVASGFIARLALAVWRMRTGQPEGDGGEGG